MPTEGSTVNLFFSLILRPTTSTLFPYTTLFRSVPGMVPGAAMPAAVMPPAGVMPAAPAAVPAAGAAGITPRSEEHTSELQSRREIVCRLLREKKNHLPQSNSHWNGLYND